MSDLESRALSAAQDVLFHFYPNGRIDGMEWCLGNFQGDAGDSIKVNLRSGKWAEFNGGMGGKNIIGFIADSRGIEYADACRLVENFLGAGTPEKKPQSPQEDFKFIIPATEEPGSIQHPQHGAPSVIYPYRNEAGKLINYICRFDFTDKPKLFAPYTQTTKGWKWKQITENRPLYGWEKLSDKSKIVVICEGEKAAEACQRLMPSVIAITWSGGSKAVKKTNWKALEGRDRVAIWPDNDEPGKSAANEIAVRLNDLGVKKISMLELSSDLAKGWDAADAEAEGLNTTVFLKKFLKEWTIPQKEMPQKSAISGEILPPEPSMETPYIALGYDDDFYYYYSQESKKVVGMPASAHTSLNLFRLGSEIYWQSTYPAKNGFATNTAASALMRQCYAAGVYDIKRVRGRGAWWDDGKCVIHLGDRLLIDGKENSLFFDSDWVYQISGKLPAPSTTPLSEPERLNFIEIAKMIKWENPVSAYFFLGWLVVAPICGALKWRPHIWLTGPKSAGKSWIMDNIMGPALGTFKLHVLSVTSQAGIRGQLGSDAIPVLFDEAEAEKQTDRGRLQDILFLMRQASSESGGSIVKGTAGGGSIEYKIRSCFALSSIGDSLEHGADESRVTVMNIAGNKGDSESLAHFAKLEERVFAMEENFHARLFARTIRLMPTIMKNQRTFTKVGAKVLRNQRAGDQLGILLAGAFSMFNEKVITEAEATEWMTKNNFEKEYTPVETENRCLERLLQAITTVSGVTRIVERSVGELVRMLIDNAVNQNGDDEVSYKLAEEHLSRRGIRILDGNLVLANNHQALNAIYRDTPWALNWPKILHQMQNVDNYNGKTVSFAGNIKARVTRIIITKS